MSAMFDLTLFQGQLSTVPVDETAGASWKTIVSIVAPADGPALLYDKSRGVYALPGLLKVAPYVGKTLARAIAQSWPSLAGKQRSASHSTGGCFLKFDLDDVTDGDLQLALAKVKALGIANLAYTTHSHGRTAGLNRIRLLIPLDRHADLEEYPRISEAAGQLLLGRSYDPSEHRPYQLFGTWMAHPDRAALAFRIISEGTLLPCDAMLEEAARVSPPKLTSPLAPSAHAASATSADVRRLLEATPWIITDDYGVWIKTQTCCAALGPIHGIDTMIDIAERISTNATAGSREKNLHPSYSPRILVETMAPLMPPEAATGSLLAIARDAAIAAVKADQANGQWSERGRAAATYLATHHRHAFATLRSAKR